MHTIILKPGREKSLLRRHPWVFSGAIQKTEGRPKAGETVRVAAANGRILGLGAFSPKSQIRVRMWTFVEETVNASFLTRRVHMAVNAREELLRTDPTLTGVRLIHGESDGLPGVIVDRYGDFLCCQFLTAGAELWKGVLVDVLREASGCSNIFERSDTDARIKEGLPKVTGVLIGEEPPGEIGMVEAGLSFGVSLREGHKTGYYLDQRANRALVGRHAADRTVLNCFAYTGGFGLHAAANGAARITNMDVSGPALDMSRRNLTRNGLAEAPVEHLEEDVFKGLRRLRKEEQKFDLIVLDPPKFVEAKNHLTRGCRGYKDIAFQAMHLLHPGGLLFTFSCSGLVTPELFQKVTADAALDAGREAVILEFLGQSPDHPTALSFPEGNYLKGLMVQVRS